MPIGTGARLSRLDAVYVLRSIGATLAAGAIALLVGLLPAVDSSRYRLTITFTVFIFVAGMLQPRPWWRSRTPLAQFGIRRRLTLSATVAALAGVSYWLLLRK